MAAMDGVFPAGIISADALDVTTVMGMNDATQGIHNFIQQGNMIPGLNEIGTQVIQLTRHAVALHSRVNGLGVVVDKFSSAAEQKIVELKTSEANLVSAVKGKIDEIEGKSASMVSEVQKAIMGIAEEFKQRDNQSFMNNSGIRVELDSVKAQSDSTGARLASVESEASSMIVKLQQRVDQLEQMVSMSASGSGGSAAVGGSSGKGAVGTASAWLSGGGNSQSAPGVMDHGRGAPWRAKQSSISRSRVVIVRVIACGMRN